MLDRLILFPPNVEITGALSTAACGCPTRVCRTCCCTTKGVTEEGVAEDGTAGARGIVPPPTTLIKSSDIDIMETSSRIISQRLFLRTTHGIKLGLDRMRAAADRIGNPQDQYPSVHIAGTNGKGSVCAYLDSCLRRMGFKSGLFTSPHIVDFEERFIINGRPVASESWVAVYRDIEPVIEELGLTFFEAATLIAFELFKREKVEWAVFETGLGGRLDATNIIRPEAAVVTRLAMDHMDLLRQRPCRYCTGKTRHCQGRNAACHGRAG